MTMIKHDVTRREFLKTGVGVLAGGFVMGPAVRSAATMPPAEALRLAREHRDELVALMESLVKISSPVGQSAGEAQQIVQRYLETNSYDVERIVEDPLVFRDHPEFVPPPVGSRDPVNLIGRAVRAPQARVAMFAHIDTEVSGEGWSTPPLSPVVRDGRMYGLGTADSKGGVAAMLVASSLLLKARQPAPLVMCLHGKGGGARGSLPAFVRKPDSRIVLYVHPAETGNGMTEIKHVSRGVLDMTLTVKGWQGRQREIRTASSAPWDEGGDTLKKCLEVVERFRVLILPDGQVNLGRLEAGEGPATVPDSCRAEVRAVWRGTRTVSDLLGRFRQEIALHQQPDSAGHHFELSVEPTGLRANPAEVEWDDPLCRTVRNAVESVTGQAPVPYRGHVSSDIRFPMRVAGEPALGIGSLGGNFYGPDEWIDLEDLVRLVAVLMVSVSALAVRT
jgi:acetylornithine deacetylase